MSVSLAWLCVSLACLIPREVEDSVGSLELETDGYEPPCECRESKLKSSGRAARAYNH